MEQSAKESQQEREKPQRCRVFTAMSWLYVLVFAIIGVLMWDMGMSWVVITSVLGAVLVFFLLWTEVLTTKHIICLLPPWRIPLAEAELTIVRDPQYTPPLPSLISVRQGKRQALLNLRRMKPGLREEVERRLREACASCREETFSFSLYGYTRQNVRGLLFLMLLVPIVASVPISMLLHVIPTRKDYMIHETATRLRLPRQFAHDAWNDAEEAAYTAYHIIAHGLKFPMEAEVCLAQAWYNRACRLGNPVAGIMLLQLELTGYQQIPAHRRRQLAEDGFRYLSRLEPDSLGDMEKEALAICYRQGFGTAQDSAKADALRRQLRHTPHFLSLPQRDFEPTPSGKDGSR